MPAMILSNDGQVTIPVAIRDLLGLKPGDRVVFVQRPDGQVVVEPEITGVRRLRGLLRHDGPAVSVEEMNDAIDSACAMPP